MSREPHPNASGGSKQLVAGSTTIGRLCVPRGLVEDLIALVPKSWHLFGHDDAHNIEVSGTRVHMCTGGSAVYMLDHELGEFRDTTLLDLYDNCRLVDSLDNIHCCQRTVIARDMATPRDLDINTAYAVVSGTRKPCGISLAESESVEPVVAMLDMIAGGDGKFRERPFCWLGATFMVPPLRAAEEAQRSLEILVRLGVPYLYAAVPQAGTTGPASLGRHACPVLCRGAVRSLLCATGSARTPLPVRLLAMCLRSEDRRVLRGKR